MSTLDKVIDKIRDQRFLFVLAIVLIVVGFWSFTANIVLAVIILLGAFTLVALVSVLDYSKARLRFAAGVTRSAATPTSTMQVYRNHEEIYAAFEEMLDSLDKRRPHIIRTVNSHLPTGHVEDRWDLRVVSFLKSSPQSQFIRVIFDQDTEEWRQRVRKMAVHYGPFPNYRQHRCNASSLPVIEMFLVDRAEVLLSFGTPAGPIPPVTFGMRVKDSELCEHLEAYHRIRLEQRIPKEDL